MILFAIQPSFTNFGAKVVGTPGKAIGWITGGVITCALVPLVSLVATSILLFQSARKYKASCVSYKATLTDNKRIAKFGRIVGQDYTQVNGKTPPQSPDSKLHDREGVYPNGTTESYPELSYSQDTFTTKEDLQWLEAEEKYREHKREQDKYLVDTLIWAKGIIPLIGAWLVWRDIDRDVYFAHHCQYQEDQTHWNLHQALYFHITNLRKNLDGETN